MARTATLRAGLPVTVGAHLLVAAAYLTAAAWATRFGIGGSVLIWFPPAGVAVAVVALGGWRFVPTLAAAEMASTIWVTGFAEEFGPVLLVVNTVAIVGAYTFGAMAMRRSGTDPELRRAIDLLHFVVYGAIGASLLAAVGGIGVQVLADLVAVPGNPLDDICHMEQVDFVMIGGKIVKAKDGE